MNTESLKSGPGPARLIILLAAMGAVTGCIPSLGSAAGVGPIGLPIDRYAAASQIEGLPALPAPEPTPSPGPSPTPAPMNGEPMVIGASVAGRPLEVFRFGQGERELLIVAGIHGGYEWNTIALADRLIDSFHEDPALVPADTSLYILRALNPDGAARSHGYEGRANENGIDLNRNWPIDWHPDWDRAACWNYLPISGGPHPVSEPEVAALMQFILAHNFEAMISYHSAALGVFPGGSPPDPASQALAQAVAAVSGYPFPPLNYGCEYTGQLADWGASQGIASIDVELTTHDSLDFEINLRVLETFVAWRP